MDRDFPSVLFPSFYNSEPPDAAQTHCAGTWGSFGKLRPSTAQTSSSQSYSFKAQHEAVGQIWHHTEPAPVPLFAPKRAGRWSSRPANPLDFSDHLQNFFVDYPLDAFSPVAGLLEDDMKFERHQQKKAKKLRDSRSIKNKNNVRDEVNNGIWPLTSARKDSYSRLLSDVVHSVPVELLASLLHEELSQQNLEAAFCEATTGGALDLIPFPSSTDGAPQSGCLVYCADRPDKLTFQKVALQADSVICSDDASTFLLKGPVQQISSSSTCGHNCAAVRSAYRCGVWGVSSSQQPRLLQAVSSTERLSCVQFSADVRFSPHVVGEVLVASESGAAHLWRLGQGMQVVRTEGSDLYFNSGSSWRWCEFSAHPRVMLYADRTGAELTDVRVQSSSSHTLFRMSRSAECRSGERLLLCRYLSSQHSFHHLITTQYAAYIMDERFPCVPMLKWDHMMHSPPVFCHVLNGCGLSTGGMAKVLLGSQSDQEVTLLQYSGGGSEACVSHGPPRALLRPRDSMAHLPIQIPHRAKGTQDRLTCPATGLTAVHLKRTPSEERICVLQLLQTGDVFYQILDKGHSPTEPSNSSNRCLSSPEQQPVSRDEELPLSDKSRSIWKQWMQRLARCHKVNRPDNALAKKVLQVPKAKNLCRRRVRTQQDSERSMCTQSLFVGAVERIQPLRVDVQAGDWSDDLSRRLTVAWDSDSAWQSWWAERLGDNNEEKTRALRRKRRREKDARRASGLSLLAMSGSFTSSLSYQSELSDASDWPWSGGESQPDEPPTQDTPKKQALASPSPSVRAEHSVGYPSAGATPVTIERRPLVQTLSSQRSAGRLRPGTSQSLDPSPLPSSSRPSSSRPLPSSLPSSSRPSSSRPSSSRPLPSPLPSSSRPSPSRPLPSSRPLSSLPSSSLPSSSLPSSSLPSSSLPPSVTPHKGASPRDAFTWSQTSSRPSQSSQPRKKSRMGF